MLEGFRVLGFRVLGCRKDALDKREKALILGDAFRGSLIIVAALSRRLPTAFELAQSIYERVHIVYQQLSGVA